MITAHDGELLVFLRQERAIVPVTNCAAMPAPSLASGVQNNFPSTSTSTSTFTSTSRPPLLLTTSAQSSLPHPGRHPETVSAGRPPPPLLASTLAIRPPLLSSRLPLSTSNSQPGATTGDDSTSSPSSSRDTRRAVRPQLRVLESNMVTHASPTPLTLTGNKHKRGSSGSSSPFSSQTQFATPFATYEEPDTEFSSIISPKIKPYLRKMSASAAKEDQGYVDLSKSVSENERLSGLGIQDFGARAMTDSALLHHNRGHDRTTSVGSQISAGSASFKTNQPFTHPMKQNPRPGISYASSIADDDADVVEEHADVVAEDFQPGVAFRTRRSMSISSMATTSYPTPLSQSHTANDLEYPIPTASAPRLLGLTHSNLSVISNHSSKSKAAARRISTDLSPSIRSSFDQAFSFSPRLPRTSTDADPLAPAPSREERIQAARRKFEEKEALKDRKAARAREAKLSKRGPRAPPLRAMSGRSSGSGSGSGGGGSPLKKPVLLRSGNTSPTEERPRNSIGYELEAGGGAGSSTRSGAEKEKERRSEKKGRKDDGEKLQSRSYASTRPTHPAAMPRHVLSNDTVGFDEKGPRVRTTHGGGKRGAPESGQWLRFSTWLQTRMLSCGGSRD